MNPQYNPNDNYRNISNISQKRSSAISTIAFIALFAFILAPIFYIGYASAESEYIGYVWSSEANHADQSNQSDKNTEGANKNVSLLFIGDMMFDRGVRTKIEALGPEEVFSSTTRFLADQFDLTIGNLEGPITSNKSRNIDAGGKAIPGFTFTFPPSTAKILQSSGIDIVSLANNHADNFGPSGFKETLKLLTENGILFFGNTTNTDSTNNMDDVDGENQIGTPRNITGSDISTIQCINRSEDDLDQDNSYCIGIVGYHQFTDGGKPAILAEIVRLREKVDFIVVFPHWGAEYQKIPSANQRALAHSWINAGADMVVGSHPHIVQSVEIFNGKPIFYSLGNYIFDQYFSYDTTHGLAIGLFLSEKNRGNDTDYVNAETGGAIEKITLIPIDITGTKVRLANDIDRIKMFENIAKISTGFVSTSTKNQILGGEINFVD